MEERELVPSVAKRVNLVDSDSLLYICCYNKKDEPEKTLEEVKSKMDLFIQDIFNKTQSTHYLLFLTLTRSFRAIQSIRVIEKEERGLSSSLR